MNKIESNLIKQKREEIGISQRELARRINVDNATISKIENGSIKKPSFDILIKLSNELNIPIFNLLKYFNYDELERLVYSMSYDENVIKGQMNEIDEAIIKNVTSVKDDEVFIDIIKILNEYKKGNINDIETIKLINLCKPYEFENQLLYKTENENICIEFYDN